MIPVEVRAQDVPCVGGSCEYREGARALLCRQRKAHGVHLGLVYCLADRQPTLVDCRFGTVHAAAVCRY